RLEPTDPSVGELIIVAPLATADETIEFNRDTGGGQPSRCNAKGVKARKAGSVAVSGGDAIVVAPGAPRIPADVEAAPLRRRRGGRRGGGGFGCEGRARKDHGACGS